MKIEAQLLPMSTKGRFPKFISALKKHFKLKYPFVQPMEQAIDVAIPKSGSFYLGISPRFNKHVIINFDHNPRYPGEVSVRVHISTELKVANFDVRDENFESFGDGYYNLSSAISALDKGKIYRCKVWCLGGLWRESDAYTLYWMPPSSYDSEEVVIKETITDVCITLEILFRMAGFME